MTDRSEFEDVVFPAELEEVGKRRETLELPTAQIGGAPSVDQELVGLALSGGGIRSATFGLGVIQGLSNHGFLKHVDFLSTVSGGGYIGSCLSSLLNEKKHSPEGADFPLKYTAGAKEPPALTHLRNSSNYLNPGGLLASLRLPNVLLRGVLSNLLVLLPFIMAAVFVTEVVYEYGPNWDHLPKLLMPLVILFMILAIAFPFAIRILRDAFDWRWRNTYELGLTIPLLLAIMLLALIPILGLTRFAIEHTTLQVGEWVSGLGPADWWRASLVLFAIVVLFMLGGKASDNLSRLSGKLALLLVGLLGPAIVFSIYLSLCLWQIDSPFIPVSSAAVLNRAVACDQPCLTQRAEAEGPPGSSSALGPALLLEEDVSTYAELIHELEGRYVEFYPDARVICQTREEHPCDAEPAGSWRRDQRVWVINDGREGDESLADKCPPLDKLDIITSAWIDQNCTYFSRGSKASLRITGAQLQLFAGPRDWWFLGIFLALLVFNRFFLDVNITSPHGFYRDRLSKAFLFGIGENDRIEQNDTLKLTDLNSDGATAPYHLINVALNLQASKAPDLRGRMCDFFIFSRRYTGSDRTGYVRTEEMEKYDRHLNLGTAMAISGAAAAPNMGVTTKRSLVSIMTLLNLRLGYWLPNPHEVERSSWLKRLRLGGAKPTLIWKEALGLLDEDGSYVNVSDGGHIENLAIYPLLKRHCKFIVAVDGGEDAGMTFGSLVTLMRYARIDMGVEIDMDLDGLRTDADGLSKERWALGTIRYSGGETGHLLYIKLSVTDDEPEYVRAYRAEHEKYPHESTADQFFTEDQFEAYRALGEDICEGMLSDVDRLGGFRNLSGAHV